MKRVRKFGALIVVLMMLAVVFAACGGKEKESPSTSAVPTPSESEVVSQVPSGKEHLTVGIAQFAEHGSLDNCRIGFIEGLAEAGYIEGENLTIVYKNAQADMSVANTIVQGFVNDGVDMICAIATPIAQAAFNAAEDKDIPVIYTAVTDPVTADLAKEDKTGTGNATGSSDKLPVSKQLEMIRAMMPEAKKIGILYSTSEVNSVMSIAEYKELAGDYGFEIVDTGIANSSDISLALDNMLTKVDCITNLTDNTVVESLALVLDKANAAGIPVFGSEIEQVKNGCIAAEGLDYMDLGRKTGAMAARVAEGENAQDIEYIIIDASETYYNSEVLAAFEMELPDAIKGKAIDVKEEA